MSDEYSRYVLEFGLGGEIMEVRLFVPGVGFKHRLHSVSLTKTHCDVFLRSNKCVECIYIFKYINSSIVYIHICLLPGFFSLSLLVHCCIAWHISASYG